MSWLKHESCWESFLVTFSIFLFQSFCFWAMHLFRNVSLRAFVSHCAYCHVRFEFYGFPRETYMYICTQDILYAYTLACRHVNRWQPYLVEPEISFTYQKTLTVVFCAIAFVLGEHMKKRNPVIFIILHTWIRSQRLHMTYLFSLFRFECRKTAYSVWRYCK